MKKTTLMTALACASIAGAMLAGFGPAQPEGKDPKGPAAAAPAPKKPTLLDKFKPLAGTWERVVDGKKQVSIVGKVTSAGHVYCETMLPGTEHEMTNMYHMDGHDLVVTHYCAAGNQPRMRCKGESAPGVFHFTFDQGTNLAKGQMYMGDLKVTIVDENTIKQEWTSLVDGKPADHNAVFELTRKK